jgi:rhodanese-related sulfurtransferase
MCSVCQSTEPREEIAMVTTANRIHEVEPANLKSDLDAGRVVLIDVREPAEHAAERIPGAKLIPLSKFDPQNLSPEKNRIVLHCRGGNRSAKAAQKLLDCGCESAMHLRGGIEAWKKAGLPIEKDARAPISIFRQVQITAGSLALLGSILGFAVSPWWFMLSGFVGAGLTFAGITDTCGMAMLLGKMPWNRVANCLCYENQYKTSPFWH